MPEHIQYEDDDLFNPETKHESSDVPVRGLLQFLVIFVVFSVVTYVVIYFLYKGLATAERNRMDPPQSAVTRPKSADVPQNQPLLQPFPRADEKGIDIRPQDDTPVVDLIKMRERENKVLQHYGWVDKQKGVVHIPIAEAKARYAAQVAVQGQVNPAAVPVTTDTAAPVPPSTLRPADPVATPANTAAPTTTTAATTSGGARP